MTSPGRPPGIGKVIRARHSRDDADEFEHDYCVACGRVPDGVCEGPGPYPRPCTSGLPMPSEE